MGIYIFTWSVLREALITNKDIPNCDFGMHVIPYCHKRGDRVFCYEFNGYWKDVGTLHSYWEANMELIDIVPVFNLYEEFWKIYTKSDNQPPQYIADTAQIERCIIGDGSEIYGRVRNCVIGPEVIVEEGAEVYDSILMQGAVIKKGTKIYKSIIAQDAVVGENCTIGVGEYADSQYNKKVYCCDLVTVAEGSEIPDGVTIGKNVAIAGKTAIDYLMYANLDYKHPEVIENIYEWADWFVETTGVQGFRMDAVKHIDSFFMRNFIRDVKEKQGQDFYVFGEFWNGNEEENNIYLEKIEKRFDLVDVPLHNNLHKASLDGADYDLTTIFDHSLVKNHPEHAVTFVDNHDTQRGQALESTVEEWFKPAAYALILLREDGLPCLFYGDYYGIEGEFAQENFQEILDTLFYARKDLAYGEQTDYFDDPNCIGWTRSGNEDSAPLAVTISNDAANSKSMEIGSDWAGQTFYDILGNCSDTVTIDEDGWETSQFLKNLSAIWTIQD